MRVATMFLALMRPGMPRYWMPLLPKMVAPALNHGTCFVPSNSSGTTEPAQHNGYNIDIFIKGLNKVAQGR